MCWSACPCFALIRHHVPYPVLGGSHLLLCMILIQNFSYILQKKELRLKETKEHATVSQSETWLQQKHKVVPNFKVYIFARTPDV